MDQWASMEFRPRNYSAEEESHSLPRVRAENDPLSTPCSSKEVDVVGQKEEIYDPLRGIDANSPASLKDLQYFDDNSVKVLSESSSVQLQEKEWSSFKKFLIQRFSVPKTVSVSAMSDVIVKIGKASERSSTNMHLEELEDPQKFAEEGVRMITQKEYVSRLHELKAEIAHSWQNDDRVTSLKLTIKVTRLMMDTSVLQFYPMLFALATDIMDMLGDMVFERIKCKAEVSEDGTRICYLPADFTSSDICSDAKETCNNWFYKIGSIQELLPRIYLELAILHCWRFLIVQPADCLKRLVTMIRGIADPLASAYCRLYMVHCSQKLPHCSVSVGYLIICINDMKVQLSRVMSARETTHGKLLENPALLIILIEPTIEYIMKSIFKDLNQRHIGDMLVDLELCKDKKELFGTIPCVSVILHHLLKELPVEVVQSNAAGIINLIECSNDTSFDQCLNYRLLGFKLCESRRQMEVTNVQAVVNRVIEVSTQYDCLEKYLTVVDAFVDIVLQYGMDNYLSIILEGVSERACIKGIAENELATLESIFIKLLTHFNNLEDAFSLSHFVEILDMMYGSSRSVIIVHILKIATRSGYLRDPTTIQFLIEICQALHDDIDFPNVKEDDLQQPARLISRFVQMVDYGAEMERQLTFLVECRGAFSGINELKETLVHKSNHLAIKAMKDSKNHLSFIKACIAFSEVTIPSISAPIRQLNLFLETAEVALLGGLISHSDGLLDSAITCLESLDLMNGSRVRADVDGILSTVRKVCSLFVMVPGSVERGVTNIPKSIFFLINSLSWMAPRFRTRILCAVITLTATLSQKKLPYHANHGKVPGNELLFFEDQSYCEELKSLSKCVLQNLVDVVHQEPSQASRGVMALEACDCIMSSFKLNPEISTICSKLIETAKLCLSENDKYLQSTMELMNKYLPTTQRAVLPLTV